MESLLKHLEKIFITSSNYKLKLGNKSFIGAEVILRSIHLCVCLDVVHIFIA